MEWQTWTSQKRLLERACGFESRSRHTAGADARAQLALSVPAGTISRMYPRSTVDLALLLSSLGVADRENAQICGVSIRTIRHWRYGTRRSPAKVQPRCPLCDGKSLDESAYAYLLGLYLGDGHLTHGRRDVYALNVKCDNSWPGLIEAAHTAMAAVMPRSSVFQVARTGCTEVKSWSKHWPCLFPQHGPGRKHSRTIALVAWQQEIITVHPGSFLRGLFHSDGCRTINRVHRALADGDRWYEYPRYLFSNESADIIGLCAQTLDRLGVRWRMARQNVLSVARRESVARMDELVGPKY
jgi:hypothetical protein